MRDKHDVFYIDEEILHLQRKRNRLTRGDITKSELLELAKEFRYPYLEVEHPRKLKQSTIDLYMEQVQQFLDFISDDEVVTKETLMRYQEHLLMNNKPSTVANKSIGVSKFIVYCGMYDAKLSRPRIKDDSSLDKIIEEGEFKAMLRGCKKQINEDPHNAAVWEEMYLTIRVLGYVGIRISEREVITVESVKKSAYIKGEMKSGFGEIVIRDRIRKELQAYAIEKRIQSGPIFKLKDYQVRYRLKTLSSKSRLQKDKFHPHAFRHFFAIQFMRQGGDIEVLRQILGHADIKTTAIYLNQTKSNIRKQINTMKLVEDTTEALRTDNGHLIKRFEKAVYGYRGNWTKKAAVSLLLEVLNEGVHE